MFNWMSFYIHDSGKIALGNLRSHVRIAKLEGIDEDDNSWHRAEWVTENYDGLIVEADDKDDNPTKGITADDLIDSICKRWKNRNEFFEWAAPQLIELDCSYGGITELPRLPKCEITELPKLPKCEILFCSHNKLTKLPELPKCKELYCHNNNLTELLELPECEVLDCSYNNLVKLPKLPECEMLYCYNNNLTELPELPKCKYLFCSNNKLTELPELPECEELHCPHNPLKEK